jgi:hypothetical protein
MKYGIIFGVINLDSKIIFTLQKIIVRELYLVPSLEIRVEIYLWD